MTLDSWLLKQYLQGQTGPILRFYQWQPVTLSLGYHQRRYPEAWEQLQWQGRPIPLVPRPTGGRAVLHQGDLCYSLILPAHLPNRQAMYAYCCEFLRQGWQTLGVELDYGQHQRGYIHNPSCFGTATAADLVMKTNQKLIGSAQLRRGGAILQQGSMVLNQDDRLFEVVFGVAQRTQPISQPLETIMAALYTAAQNWFGGTWTTAPLTDAEWQMIRG